jgi:hypothetical protein
MPNNVVAALYKALMEGMREWHADLYHVAMRIRAIEEGTPDPGTLLEAQNKRQEEQAEKEKAKATG